MQNLDNLTLEILAGIEAATSLEALEAVRIDVFGKKGRVSLMMRELGGMDPGEQGRRAGAECGQGSHRRRHRDTAERAVTGGAG